MTVTFTIAIYAAVFWLVILAFTICLLKVEPVSLRSVILESRNYLTSGPVSLTLAVLIGIVELALTAGGIREGIRSEFGLPNENVWAYFAYAFIHADIRHFLENTGSLLICGGIVEERVGSRWFLVLVVLCVPSGSYLTTLTAPVFIDSPWTSDLHSVGFSIVGYAVLALCAIFVIDFVWRERPFRLAPERLKWWLAATFVLLFFIFSFISGISDSPGESILGHSIGIALGAAAGGLYWVVHRIRNQGTA